MPAFVPEGVDPAQSGPVRPRRLSALEDWPCPVEKPFIGSLDVGVLSCCSRSEFWELHADGAECLIAAYSVLRQLMTLRSVQ